MNNDIVSIIIPIYNVEQYLEKCLRTIINQTYKKLEIILVNDGSVDNSGVICDSYSEHDDRIKVIHKKNEGVSIARNSGIKVATGKYLVFVDPDDYVATNHIETLYNVIEKNNDVDLVISNAIDIDEEGKVINDTKKYDFIMDKYQCWRELLSDDNFYHVCWGNIYKRKLLDNCLFNEKYRIAEDLDFLYNYISNINKAYFLSKKTYYWVKRKDSVTNCKYSEKWNDELEIISLIIDKTLEYKNDLHKYAKKKYIMAHMKQLYRFDIDRKHVKLFKNNIKLYKNEIFADNKINIKDKFKINLFLKSYTLFRFTLNSKKILKKIKIFLGNQ